MEYEQGSNQTFYAQFVTYQNVEADVTSGAVTISHYRGNNEVIDINNQPMTLLSGSTYYYEYNIPSAADKTIYNVKYVGAFADGTVAVGGEDFQVIPKGNFSRGPRGMTQRLIKKDIWTKKEKEAVLDALDRMMELKSLKDDVTSLSSETLTLANNLKTLKDDEEATLTLIRQLPSNFDRVEKMLKQHEDQIKKLDKKDIRYDDSKIIYRLTNLGKSISSLDTGLRNEKTGRIIAELEDLHKEIDEFKEVFAETIPLSIKERIKNEVERTNSNEI